MHCSAEEDGNCKSALNLIDGQAVHLLWYALNDLSESLVVLHGLGDGSVVVLRVDGRVAAHASDPSTEKT